MLIIGLNFGQAADFLKPFCLCNLFITDFEIPRRLVTRKIL